MARTFSVKGWKKFQHYKKRNPPWIRLYNSTLDDYAVANLPDTAKAHLFGIWLLASKHENQIPGDSVWIASKINATTPVDLEQLASAGLIIWKQDASKPRAPRKQNPLPETEQRTETDKKEERGEDSKDLVRSLLKEVSVNDAERSSLPPEKRKQVWQTKIIAYAQRTMGDREFVVWCEAFGNQEKWAIRKANEMDRERKADEARQERAA